MEESVFNEIKERKTNNKIFLDEEKNIVIEKSRGFDKIYLKNEVVGIYPIDNISLGRLEGIRIEFFPIDEQKTYTKTDGTGVVGFPKNLYIDLDIKNLSVFVSYLIGAVSSYLYNIRHKVTNFDVSRIIKVKKFNNDKYLKLTLSKHFFRGEGEQGRYKISTSFIQQAPMDIFDDTELINFNLTKRDVVLILNLIKKLTSSYLKDAAIPFSMDYFSKDTNEYLGSKTGIIGKIFNSIIIDDVWFHGQELLHLMYVTHELIYNLNIEKKLNIVHGNYRQISITSEEDILYLNITKMNNKQEIVYSEFDGEEAIIKIPIGAVFIAALYLYLDIEILKHMDFESEDYRNEKENVLGKLLHAGNIRYHISLKESLLGVDIAEVDEKSNKRKSKNQDVESVIRFAGVARRGQFNVEDESGNIQEDVIIKYDEYNIPQEIPLLSEFNIDLKDRWPMFIKALSYGLTEEYLEEGREFNTVKFFVINREDIGYCKYSFTIYSDVKNKASTVILIDKYKMNKGGEETILGRFRQPLFRKYIYELLLIFLAAGKEVNNVQLTDETTNKELLPYKHRSYKTVEVNNDEKVVNYGIRKKSDGVYWGNFTNFSHVSKLPIQDIDLLNISSEFRIFNKKRWLPFTGDRISVTQNGYITDMFSEKNLEKDNQGVVWAIRIYYGTETKY